MKLPLAFDGAYVLDADGNTVSDAQMIAMCNAKTTFAQAVETMEHFDTVAGRIIRIYDEEGAFTTNYGSSYFYPPNIGWSCALFEPSAKGTVKIKGSKFRGDSEDFVSLTANADWFDNFDEAAVRATAKGIVTNYNYALQRKADEATAAKRESDIATLRRLQAEYPDAAGAA